MKASILVIEDNDALARSLQDRLRSSSYDVARVSDGLHGLQEARRRVHDLIILDGMLPGMDGLDVLSHIREDGSTTPVLMLTARGQTTDKVVGLTYGADDYMTKPFEMVELLARIEALLRRSGSHAPREHSVLEAGPIRVDTALAEVRQSGRLVALSAREFSLLVYFLQHTGRIIRRDELLREVWGYEEGLVTRTVDVHVGQLRQKLERNPGQPEFIRTVHGFGYRFDAPSDTQ